MTNHDFLPHDTLEDKRNLILHELTLQELKVDTTTLGRHSSVEVFFRCVVCQRPTKLSMKRVLDGKGLSHAGECRTLFRRAAGKKARKNEDPIHKKVRKEKLQERMKKDKDLIVGKRQATLTKKYGTTKISEIEPIRKNISNGIKKVYLERGEEVVRERQATNLEKYGSTNFLTSDQGTEITKTSNQNRFGTDFPFQNQEFQALARQAYVAKTGFENPANDPLVIKRREQTNIERGFIKILSSGEKVADHCDKNNIKHSNAFKILRQHGEQAFYDYVRSGPTTSSLETLFIRLLEPEFPNLKHFNQKPIEAPDLNYKPDFRLNHHDKVLYVNVDGLYWHSLLEKESSYHLRMRQAFLQKKLQLIQFREDEINDKSQIVKSIILNKFGFSKKIYARRCSIKTVEFKEAREFLRENHLMGSATASYYGLIHDNETVALIGVKTKDRDLEIVRFSSKNFTSIQGGFSRLLDYVIKIYNPTNILSFCDLRYSDGHSYQKLGFTLESISQGWQWTDFKSTFNRLKCRANMDDRRLSEKQHAEELGWVKIYDAGQAKFVKKIR